MRVVDSSSASSNSREREILGAQTRLLYANVGVAVCVTIVAAALLSLVQWPVVSHFVIVAWLLAMSLVSVWRYALAQRFQHAPPDYMERRWRIAAAVGAGLAGAGWGAAGILLYPQFHLANQVLLVFVLGGMMLGAATLLAARPEAFLAFLIPAGLGPTARLLAHGDKMHYAMGLLAATYTIAIVITTWRVHRMINSSIWLKFVNRDLLQDVQSAVAKTEELNEQLEVKVQERTAELRKSTEQLQAEIRNRQQVAEELLRTQQALLNSEKLSATARLAATMAHEINNPLAAITNLVFLLAPLQTSPEGRAYVATIEEKVQSLSRIATQMLKFHRDCNRPSEYKLSAALCEVLDFYRPQAAMQGVNIRQSLDAEGIVVGYKGEIVQVVTNLLLNALEATPVGGKIRVHLFPASRWSQELHNRVGYYISIADNGRGIDPDQKARIFEPFFTTKGDKGTGLGLWVCRGIISRAGGSIRVRSTQRAGCSGTCISVFLPAEVPGSVEQGRRRYECA